MTAAEDGAPIVVDLGPTRAQLVNAFGLTVAGLLAAAAFIVLGIVSTTVQPAGLVLGVLVGVLAVASALFEYRALPGGTLTMDTRQVVFRTFHGRELAVPTGVVTDIGLEYVAPTKHRRQGITRFISTQRGIGWWLAIGTEPPDGADRPGFAAFRVGIGPTTVRTLQSACDRFTIPCMVGEGSGNMN